MSHVIDTVGWTLLILFAGCYFYQFVYLIVGLVKKDPEENKPVTLHRFAVLIPARNEETVITGLLESIQKQDYPTDLITVYVIADNCTDRTAQAAMSLGARVISRFNNCQVGKGYALDYALQIIDHRDGLEAYDGFFVFDADNVLDPGYFTAMNRTFSQGYDILTSYRNSKNYGENWITAAYALWFLRESRFLNGARMKLHTSCAISGTGFLVSSQVLQKEGGWKYHLLTEDIQFSAAHISQGLQIGYCKDAVLYDEQPARFRDSWNQRLRWTKGFYQVFYHYGRSLISGVVHHRGFQYWDMLMVLAPGSLITLASLAFYSGCMFLSAVIGDASLALDAGRNLLGTLLNIYLSLLFFGGITLITERERIHCGRRRQVLYLLLFPVFILTYVPMTVIALKKNVTWKHIPHSILCTADQIVQQK